jgi:hypothetical protein
LAPSDVSGSSSSNILRLKGVSYITLLRDLNPDRKAFPAIGFLCHTGTAELYHAGRFFANNGCAAHVCCISCRSCILSRCSLIHVVEGEVDPRVSQPFFRLRSLRNQTAHSPAFMEFQLNRDTRSNHTAMPEAP